MCGCNKKRERWIITLANGLRFTKATEGKAKEFAAQHPGSMVKKVGS